MSEIKERSKPKLIPTEGIIDYASEYKKVVENKNKIIASAKYFMRLRKSHLTEILNSWDEYVDDITLEQAELLLNEFLSPTCTLLEFEFRNFTKAGRDEPELHKPETITRDNISKIWQRHILGKVLTTEEQKISITIPADAKHLFASCQPLTEDDKESGKNGKVEKPVPKSLDRSAVEIFTIYKQIRWFINHIDIDKLTLSRFVRADIKKGIDDFNRAFNTTWNAVICLVYMEILESLRSDAAHTVSILFAKCSKLMIQERHGISSKESSELLKCANLFILKYRGGDDEDALFRCGFGFLGAKLQILKSRNETDPSILSVASSLAEEEANITGVYELLKTIYDFSTCKV